MHRRILTILFLAALLLSSTNLNTVIADVPTVTGKHVQFKASPEGEAVAHFTVRHANPTPNHIIDKIQVDVDGALSEFSPTPAEQVAGTLDYSYPIQASSGSVIRARSHCNVHGWSSWTTIEARLYTLTVEAPQGGGSTNPVPGTYRYSSVVTVPVTANPSPGWAFSHWLMDGADIGNQNPYTVNMSSDHTIESVFRESAGQSSYTLIVEAQEGLGSTNPVPGSYTYSSIVPVPVTATPSPGWKLSHWLLDDVDIGDQNPYTVTMSSDQTIKAVFTLVSTVSYRLTIELPEGSGSTKPPEGSYTYNEVVQVGVTATPSSGWQHSHWLLDGANIGDENPYTVSMNSDHTLKAVFKAVDSGTSSGIPGFPTASMLLGGLLGLATLWMHQRARAQSARHTHLDGHSR